MANGLLIFAKAIEVSANKECSLVNYDASVSFSSILPTNHHSLFEASMLSVSLKVGYQMYG
ncbi:hypothetical protein ACE6H2_018158 [Prunus campanulata]